MLDKNSPVPLYIQFKEHLLDLIETGQLKPDDRLSSERQFCEQFEISRITVRQALKELMRDGVITSVPGKGTFVAHKPTAEFHPLLSFSQLTQTRGQKPSSRVLNQTVIHAAPRLARELQIPPNSQAYRIERLRLADDTPHVWQIAYLPSALCPDILTSDLEKGSLYKALINRYGLTPVRANNSFEARLAESEEEQLLHQPHPSAVLVMRQTSYLKDDRPIEYTRSIYRAHERFHVPHTSLISDEEVF